MSRHRHRPTATAQTTAPADPAAVAAGVSSRAARVGARVALAVALGSTLAGCALVPPPGPHAQSTDSTDSGDGADSIDSIDNAAADPAPAPAGSPPRTSPQPVSRPKTTPTPGHRLGPVSTVPGAPAQHGYRPGGTARYIEQPDGTLLRWGTCGGTIAVNPAGMSRADLIAVRGGVTYFLTHTAGTWQMVTTTAATPSGAGTVLVRLAPRGLPGHLVGNAQSSYLDAGPEAGKIQHTLVELDPIVKGSPTRIERAVAHELAHAVGLDHTSDPRNLMFASEQGSTVTFTAAEHTLIEKVTASACR